MVRVFPEDLNDTDFCTGPVSLTSREDVRLRVFENRVKVKCTLAQTLRLCTGRKAHRRSRDISLLIHDHGT
jgi:hypothetical protein